MNRILLACVLLLASFAIQSDPNMDDLNTYQQCWFWVQNYCYAFGIMEQAPAMMDVIYRESCFQPLVERGDYEGGNGSIGVAQFEKRTFLWTVREMRRLGMIRKDEKRDPRNIRHAVAAMAFCWWQGMHRHWAPVRKGLVKV